MASVTRRFLSVWIALLLVPSISQAACPDDQTVAAYISDFIALRPSTGFGPDLTLEDAACARAQLAKQLPDVLGPVVGYKAVFTNPDSQRRFGVSGPAWAVMFSKGMVADGAHLSAKFGARPRYEADFVVVVKDAGLADAETPAEALSHISALIPFIELPDIMLAGKPSGAELVATNAAFRAGVLGKRIEVNPENAAQLLAALGSMEVVVSEANTGQEVGRARGDVLMGNPINAALWLAHALKQDGVVLQPGDLLSLGGFLGSAPTQAGNSMSVQYLGLPGDPVVNVSFD